MEVKARRPAELRRPPLWSQRQRNQQPRPDLQRRSVVAKWPQRPRKAPLPSRLPRPWWREAWRRPREKGKAVATVLAPARWRRVLRRPWRFPPPAAAAASPPSRSVGSESRALWPCETRRCSWSSSGSTRSSCRACTCRSTPRQARCRTAGRCAEARTAVSAWASAGRWECPQSCSGRARRSERGREG